MNSNELKSLSVLAFLLYRLGWYERAERVYAGIVALCAEGDPERRGALAGLAASQIEQKKAAEALANVDAAIAAGPVATAQAGMYLIRAQALWQLDRKTEARTARDRYQHLAGTASTAGPDNQA